MTTVLTLVLTLHSDPGHAWLEVPAAVLKTYGIAKCISPWSYSRSASVFLEEDQDAAILLIELKRRGVGYSIQRTTTNSDSPIRSYKQYPSSPRWKENAQRFLKDNQPLIAEVRGY